MERPITHLVVNDIWIEDNIICVGATDNERWRCDIEDGESGADAWSFVFITLTKTGTSDDGRDWFSETAQFHCKPGDPVRDIAMAQLSELSEIAWTITNNKLDLKSARKKYFGKQFIKAFNTLK